MTMKKIVLLLIVMIAMSGCYVGFRNPYYRNLYMNQNRIRTPYYQSHPNRGQRYIPGRKYNRYFRPGRY
jgi:uncharacterized protein YceK